MLMLRRLTSDLGGIAVVVALMLLINYLPPDTSLQEVKARDVIRACVPTSYPPLITGDPERPGIDIELLRAVADHMDVELLLSPVDAMGRDFNPRRWAINRARCQVLAGGVVDSALTRSFLDTGPAYAQTGWAIVAPAPLEEIDGLTLGALTVISGLDRIGLSSYLRHHDVTPRVVRDAGSLIEGIANGQLDGGVTELLLAGGLAADHNWWVTPLPIELSRYNLVFGLWKGDLTLKREVVEAFNRLEADGTLADILERYGAAPIDESGSTPAL